MTKRVQFNDAKDVIISVFGSPQDEEVYPNQADVDDNDPRYLAFINPPDRQNSSIKAQLAELDGKSVRALHEAVLALAASGAALPADTTKRLQDLETQKQELRAKLI